MCVSQSDKGSSFAGVTHALSNSIRPIQSYCSIAKNGLAMKWVKLSEAQVVEGVVNNMAGYILKECDADIKKLKKMESGQEVCENVKENLPQIYGQARYAEFMNDKQGKDEAGEYWRRLNDKAEVASLRIEEEKKGENANPSTQLVNNW